MQTTTPTTDIFVLADESRSKRAHLETRVATAREEEARAERAFETSPSAETNAEAAVARQLTKNAQAALDRHIEDSRETLAEEARERARLRIAELLPLADARARTSSRIQELELALLNCRAQVVDLVSGLDSELQAAFVAERELLNLQRRLGTVEGSQDARRMQLNDLLLPLGERLRVAVRKGAPAALNIAASPAFQMSIGADPMSLGVPTVQLQIGAKYEVAR